MSSSASWMGATLALDWKSWIALGRLSYVLPEVIAIERCGTVAHRIFTMSGRIPWKWLTGYRRSWLPYPGEYDPDTASNLMLGLVSIRLGRYRQALENTWLSSSILIAPCARCCSWLPCTMIAGKPA